MERNIVQVPWKQTSGIVDKGLKLSNGYKYMRHRKTWEKLSHELTAKYHCTDRTKKQYWRKAPNTKTPGEELKRADIVREQI